MDCQEKISWRCSGVSWPLVHANRCARAFRVAAAARQRFLVSYALVGGSLLNGRLGSWLVRNTFRNRRVRRTALTSCVSSGNSRVGYSRRLRAGRGQYGRAIPATVWCRCLRRLRARTAPLNVCGERGKFQGVDFKPAPFGSPGATIAGPCRWLAAEVARRCAPSATRGHHWPGGAARTSFDGTMWTSTQRRGRLIARQQDFVRRRVVSGVPVQPPRAPVCPVHQGSEPRRPEARGTPRPGQSVKCRNGPNEQDRRGRSRSKGRGGAGIYPDFVTRSSSNLRVRRWPSIATKCGCGGTLTGRQ